ncbi:MAG: response regulator [Myxococcales bacterium]|nr:response regulator [Myxococcales bacterium]
MEKGQVSGMKDGDKNGGAMQDLRAMVPTEFAEGIEMLPSAVVVMDINSRIRYVNRAFERRSGVARADAIGANLPELLSIDQGDYDACVTRIAEDRPWTGRWIAVLKTRPAWIQEVQASPMHNQGEVIDSVMLVIRDLTKEDSLAQRLSGDSSMTAINSLAAGVAHEINNPLSFIVGNVAYLVEEFERMRPSLGAELVEEWGEALDDLKEGAVRVRDIVQQLGGMVPDLDEGLGNIDLGALIDTTLALVQNQIRHRAHLVREYAGSNFAWTNASILSQVLLNLLLNAAESMDPGHADENELRLILRSGSEGRVTIEVRDSGRGITSEILPHIFDPFFSTKPVGDGTGMGLTVTRRLLTQLEGHITVRSTVGKGSSFIVSLPALDKSAPRRKSLTEDIPKRHNHVARILVVDDEHAVLRTVERILNKHDVVSCDEGEEALRLMQEHDFDIVFCDLMMPKMSGQELYQTVLERQPELAKHFVFITGGAFMADAIRFAKEVSNPVIEKPFTPVELRALVDLHVHTPPPPA